MEARKFVRDSPGTRGRPSGRPSVPSAPLPARDAPHERGVGAARTTARSCGSPSRRSARWSPSRCSCSPTPRSSATSARPRWPRSASPAPPCTTVVEPVRVPRVRDHGRGRPPARRRRPRGALAQGIDGLWLAALIGGVAGGGTAGLRPAGRRRPRAVADVAPLAETYLRISAAGIPAMLVVLAATGVLRGLQDTRTPLVVVVAGAIGQRRCSTWCSCTAPDLGIAGSALGTVITQWALAAVLAVVVVRGARRHGASLRPDRRGIVAAAHAGVPLRRPDAHAAGRAARHDVRRDPAGRRPVAAHQVAFTLWTFLAFVLDAIAIAGQAITGRALGASDVDRHPGSHPADDHVGPDRRRRRRAGLLAAARPVLPLFSTTPPSAAHWLPSCWWPRSAADQRRRVRPRRRADRRRRRALPGRRRGDHAGRVPAARARPARGQTPAGRALVGVRRLHAARMATLLWRERGDAWLVTGAAR